MPDHWIISVRGVFKSHARPHGDFTTVTVVWVAWVAGSPLKINFRTPLYMESIYIYFIIF